MKKRRKTKKCLNCSYLLKDEFEFCPKCGQENTNNQITFKKLTADFFSNYFSLDSRFGRSFEPFFIQPGILTREFMEGRRVKYANPIRLYLVVSLIHFFTLSQYTSIQDEDMDERGAIIQINSNPNDAKIDSLSTVNDSIPRVDESESAINGSNLELIENMVKEDYKLNQIMDSLDLKNASFAEKIILKQVAKTQISGNSSLSNYIIQSIPILMFFLLPIYALLLKLFFRKRLYINHVVHSLHIHSFLFLLLTLFWVIAIFGFTSDWLLLIVLFLTTIYITISFKITYSISVFKAIYKTLLSGIVYFFIMLFSSILFMFISILTF